MSEQYQYHDIFFPFNPADELTLEEFCALAVVDTHSFAAYWRTTESHKAGTKNTYGLWSVAFAHWLAETGQVISVPRMTWKPEP